MQLLKINSTIINSVAYDKTKKVLLTVFASGKAYLYYGVPINIFQEFLLNSSQGSYHRKTIQKFYEYEQVMFDMNKKINYISTNNVEFMVRKEKNTKQDIRKELLKKKVKGNKSEIEKKIDNLPDSYLNTLLTLNYNI